MPIGETTKIIGIYIIYLLIITFLFGRLMMSVEKSNQIIINKEGFDSGEAMRKNTNINSGISKHKLKELMRSVIAESNDIYYADDDDDNIIGNDDDDVAKIFMNANPPAPKKVNRNLQYNVFKGDFYSSEGAPSDIFEIES